MDRPTHRTIAYYCVSTHLGGAERGLLDLVTRVSELSARWYRPWVVVPEDSGPLVERLEEHEVPFEVLPMPRGLFGLSRASAGRSVLAGALAWPVVRRYVKRLEGLITEAVPALVHTTGIKCHAISGRLARSVPVLWHLRDVLEPGGTLNQLRSIRQRNNVHVLSNSYATALAFDPDAAEPLVVPNGIDVVRFAPDATTTRARPRDVPVVGVVGVIQRGEGHADFIDMAARLKASGVRARFRVVADEIHDTGRDHGLRHELEQRVTGHGLQEDFEFTGYRDDGAQAIRSLDVLVSASTDPGSFGRVLVEAMACGVPVVASALGGTLEIIDDRICGRLFPGGDTAAMGQAVIDLLEDQELRDRCIAAGRQRVQDRFTLDRHASGVIRTYDRIL